MRQPTHMQGPWSVLALAAALLTALPAQAALTAVTLDSGLQASQDAATGLLWRSFDAAAAGAQAGFRQATVADFNALLNNQGYQSTGTVPYGLTEKVVIPAVTKTVDMGWGFSTIDGTSVSQAATDKAALLYRQYKFDLDSLALGEFPVDAGVTADSIKTAYRSQALFYASRNGLSLVSKIDTVTITPEQIIYKPIETRADGIEASYYASNATSGFQVDGMHEYDNSYSSFAPEYHRAFIGQVAAGESFWVGATTSNYIPHQCQPGDSGYNQYSNKVQYCGGRAYTTAYLGPEGSTEFSNSSFSRTDYLTGSKPFGYLMVKAVPEPSTYALMGLGLVAMAWVRSRRSQRNI
jgi:hypothetical protein